MYIAKRVKRLTLTVLRVSVQPPSLLEELFFLCILFFPRFFFFFGLFLQLPFVVWLVWNISCEQIHDLLSCLCVPLLWEYTSTTNLKEGIPVCVWVFYSGMKKEFWCKIMIIWKVLSWMLVHSGTHFSKSMIRGENKHMQRDMLYN